MKLKTAIDIVGEKSPRLVDVTYLKDLRSYLTAKAKKAQYDNSSYPAIIQTFRKLGVGLHYANSVNLQRMNEGVEDEFTTIQPPKGMCGIYQDKTQTWFESITVPNQYYIRCYWLDSTVVESEWVWVSDNGSRPMSNDDIAYIKSCMQPAKLKNLMGTTEYKSRQGIEKEVKIRVLKLESVISINGQLEVQEAPIETWVPNPDDDSPIEVRIVVLTDCGMDNIQFGESIEITNRLPTTSCICVDTTGNGWYFPDKGTLMYRIPETSIIDLWKHTTFTLPQ